MKNILMLSSLLLCGVFCFISCKDDTFCIEDYSYEATAIESEEEVSFTLPSGEQYSGGGLEHSFKLGEYDMVMEVATKSLIETETGANVNLIHYFYDDKGNSFWSDDNIVLTNIGELGQATADYDLNIIDGRGDFECANGQLTMDLSTDAIQGDVDFTLSGKICGGCE